MALVVLLKGINVGGHRTCRPAALAQQLRQLDVVNLGAAGTFVVRRPVTQATLRREFARRLPFAAEIIICRGRDLLGLMAQDLLRGCRPRPDIVRFVSVLARRPRTMPPLPMSLPSPGGWLLQVLAREGRFAVGIYRRQMQSIRCLGELDRVFGVAVTTRSWSTMAAVVRVLQEAPA